MSHAGNGGRQLALDDLDDGEVNRVPIYPGCVDRQVDYLLTRSWHWRSPDHRTLQPRTHADRGQPHR